MELSMNEDDIKETKKALELNPDQPWFGKVDFTPNKLTWNDEQNRVYQEIKTLLKEFYKDDEKVEIWFHQRSTFTAGLKPLQIIEISKDQKHGLMHKLLALVKLQITTSYNKKLKKNTRSII